MYQWQFGSLLIRADLVFDSKWYICNVCDSSVTSTMTCATIWPFSSVNQYSFRRFKAQIKKGTRSHYFAEVVNSGERVASFPPGKVVHLQVDKNAMSW